jgi:hypothetical protein
MPFDEDEVKPSTQSQKIGINKVSSQKSIFEEMPKKPTPEEFEKKVKQVQEKASSYQIRTSELAMQFNKAMVDKTLSQNKNMFQKEVELDLLRSMVKLAQEINNDANEKEAEGSLSWITVLLKTCFNQRDRINYLEYMISQIEKKLDPATVSALVSKELSQLLDKSKKSE